MEENTNQSEMPSQKSHKVTAVQNILEGNEENFMTVSPKEKAVWIKMMKTRHATLVKREQENKKWHESLLQRHVNIYNRSRKLLNAQRDRFRFLFKMSEVINNLSENKIDNGQQETQNEDGKNNHAETRDDDTNENSKRTEGVENTTEKQNGIIEGDNSVPTIVVREPSQQ